MVFGGSKAQGAHVSRDGRNKHQAEHTEPQVGHRHLIRGEHVFLAQRHRVQVRGFKRRAQEVLGLFWEGRLRLLDDFGT